MKLNHVAFWVNDLELMKAFYVKWLHGKAGNKYVNPNTGFESYFIIMEDRLKIELMKSDMTRRGKSGEEFGLAHIAISLGNKEAVDGLTRIMKKDGIIVVSEPRTTGDGYYESVIKDPEGNEIELTI